MVAFYFYFSNLIINKSNHTFSSDNGSCSGEAQGRPKQTALWGKGIKFAFPSPRSGPFPLKSFYLWLLSPILEAFFSLMRCYWHCWCIAPTQRQPGAHKESLPCSLTKFCLTPEDCPTMAQPAVFWLGWVLAHQMDLDQLQRLLHKGSGSSKVPHSLGVHSYRLDQIHGLFQRWVKG